MFTCRAQVALTALPLAGKRKRVIGKELRRPSVIAILLAVISLFEPKSKMRWKGQIFVKWNMARNRLRKVQRAIEMVNRPSGNSTILPATGCDSNEIEWSEWE